MKIIFLGAGNLATNLALELHKNKFHIAQIFSRSLESSKDLAVKLNTKFTNNISEVSKEADLYIISVKDDAISSIVDNFAPQNKLIVHTAGSISMDIFKYKAVNYGVFYPLQTFTKNKKADFSEIPICLEANSIENLTILKNIAQKLSSNVQIINSNQRKVIHLAGVFACNFTNHLLSIANEILENENISLDILFPLINESIQKAQTEKPHKIQTGPAIRNDQKVMQAHLALLEKNPNFAEIYKILSKSIFDFSQKK